MKKYYLLILIVIFLSTGIALATGDGDVNTANLSTEDSVVGDDSMIEEGTRAQKEEALIIRTGRLNSTGGRIEGTEGVTMIKGDVEINAEKLLYHEERKRAEISGEVQLYHEKGEISSRLMEAWIDDDRYIFQEDVLMLQKLTDGEFNLRSSYLELLKEDNSFQAEKGVLIEYNGRILKGETVFYNDKEQTLELITNVHIEEENGDWVKSEKALFYLENEEFTAEGEVELELEITSN